MELPLAELLGIGVSLLFSAFFSASETALSSLSEVKLQQMLEKRPRWAKPLLHWKNNPNGILVTILVGNNIANITASALAADWASRHFPSNGLPIAIGAMTFLLLVSGEITPKTFARRYAEAAAPPLMRVVLIFHLLFFPLGFFLTRFMHLLFSLVGGTGENRKTVTEEDIQFVVRMGRREGTLDEDKESLLTSVLEFTDTTAKEIMVPRTDLVTLFQDTAYDEVVQVSLESGFSRIPVKKETIDNVVGVFYTKDLLPRPKASERAAFLRKRMRPAVFIPESKKISEVLKQFQRDHFHMAVVVNEFGGTEGIVTMEDIVEELLGEIQDEFDVEEARLIKLKDGSYSADARVEIEELESAFSVTFPEEREYESLGGFLMEKAGEVPAAGWQHNFFDLEFVVTEADLNKVIQVQITPSIREPADEGEADTSAE